MKVGDIAKLLLESFDWFPGDENQPTLFQAYEDTTPIAEDAHLWMWVTDNYLRDGLWLMDQLGFRYVRTMVWVKMKDENADSSYAIDTARHALQIGLGQYLRGGHELCLFGTRGQACVPEPGDRMPSVIFAERTKHSAKPQEAYDVIERVSPGPRLEVFARNERPGWSVWGNEV